MSETVFKNVEMAPPIEVFELTRMFNECQSPDKAGLGAGAYRTDEGKPWVLPVVQKVELQMAQDRTLNHEYLPVAGMVDFRNAAIKLLLGSDHKVVTENRAIGFQSIGGTGAIGVAAKFMRTILDLDTVYISNPSWANHRGIFQRAGFPNVREYRYWDNANRGLDFTGMCEDLSAAPKRSVVILHAIAHNPTGMDPTREQWAQIRNICQERNHVVLMDIAYQGFASGDLEEDAWAARYFAEMDADLFVTQSFSKNFGLYNERTGNLVVVTKDNSKTRQVQTQMEIVIRTIYSTPPQHGARIVATVLNNDALFLEWKEQVMTMANRIKKMRQELVENLKRLGTPGNWDHITKQIGMFSYTGLTETQVKHLISKHIFLLSSGRISLCGLTEKNVGYIAGAIDEAIKLFPSQ